MLTLENKGGSCRSPHEMARKRRKGGNSILPRGDHAAYGLFWDDRGANSAPNRHPLWIALQPTIYDDFDWGADL